MGKSKDKVKIELIGKSADGVTGSMYYITYNDKQILLEAGLYQTSGDDILKQYKVNHRNYHVPFSELDAVVVSHCHRRSLVTCSLPVCSWLSWKCLRSQRQYGTCSYHVGR